ncbi:hypothetical protein KC678_03020 [Candidatus Dojkabacteria bacterium]|uniref:Type II secretion system protein n=1 Tax=Candidatus Dojkabacteria bacterium TaxID=2099670 RepID=A0A955L1E4_9BACT|nr:hypothetical protein [Candidatus Dojkabacteria bacterium]
MRLDLILFLVATIIGVVLFLTYRTKSKPGLTPIEVVLTSGLIISLTSAVFVSVSLNLNFAETRNAQRSNDVFQIANAVNLYDLDNFSQDETIKTIPTCPTIKEIGILEGNINLLSILNQKYILSFPVDPSEGTTAATGYFICQDNDRFKVSAPHAEGGRVIQMVI